MQLKLEVALLASSDENSEIVNTVLGKGRCTWEDEDVILSSCLLNTACSLITGFKWWPENGIKYFYLTILIVIKQEIAVLVVCC